MVESVEETSQLEKIVEKEFKEDDPEDKVVQEKLDEEGNVIENKEKTENSENNLLAKESWDEIGVSENVKKSLLDMKFVKPSKIQAVSYDIILKNQDKHLVAQSQNGSGKTGAFCIPTISKIDESLNEVQAVILAHNNEMVVQIYERISLMAKYTNIKITEVRKNNQAKKGQIMVMTPGIFSRTFLQFKQFSLNNLKTLVLDEADYLIKTDSTKSILQNVFEFINKSTTKVQILFFSATFEKTEYKFINNYFKGKVIAIKVAKQELTLKNVRQMYIKCNHNKDEMIEEYLKANINNERVIIFVNSKKNTVSLQQRLVSKGYKVYILMGGDMDPENRAETVRRFNLGQIQILITTDLLSRGFDEKLVKLIINYDVPITKDENSGMLVPAVDTYLHRIGRTGRFNEKGIGLTLVDSHHVKDIKVFEDYYGSTIEEISSMDTLIAEFKKLLNEY